MGKWQDSRKMLGIGDIVAAIFVIYNLLHRDISVYWGITVPALRKLRQRADRPICVFKSGKFNDGGESVRLRPNISCYT